MTDETAGGGALPLSEKLRAIAADYFAVRRGEAAKARQAELFATRNNWHLARTAVHVLLEEAGILDIVSIDERHGQLKIQMEKFDGRTDSLTIPLFTHGLPQGSELWVNMKRINRLDNGYPLWGPVKDDEGQPLPWVVYRGSRYQHFAEFAEAIAFATATAEELNEFWEIPF